MTAVTPEQWLELARLWSDLGALPAADLDRPVHMLFERVSAMIDSPQGIVIFARKGPDRGMGLEGWRPVHFIAHA